MRNRLTEGVRFYGLRMGVGDMIPGILWLCDEMRIIMTFSIYERRRGGRLLGCSI